MKGLTPYCFLLFILPFIHLEAQDSISLKGQLSVYTHINPDNKLPWWSGGRYIPQLNYEYRLNESKLLDFEASANIYANAGIKPFDTSKYDGNVKPYRLWARYSTNQMELRAGLQKINFGSASILRPLMWFDQMDPRDPLKLTDGVYGILARYYFLNNTNLWLWGLYGNENHKGWETFNSVKNIPEFGGRIQIPVPKGETAFSYHHRVADGSILSDSSRLVGNIPENRFGFDTKFDMTVGWWVEASWSNYSNNAGQYTNQEILNMGIDYTIGVGKGLTVIFEQLITAYDNNPFVFNNTTTFSLLSLSYPIAMFDHLSAIIYYNWTELKTYTFFNWKKQFNRFSFYLMGYINPKEYNIPSMTGGEMLYAGSGLQIMAVFNH